MTKSNELLELTRQQQLLKPESLSERERRIVRYANWAADPELPPEIRDMYGKFRYWISRIQRHGVTDQLAIDLNRDMSALTLTAAPMLNINSRKLTHGFAWDTQRFDLDGFVAFSIASLISEGLLKKLKRCQYRKCQKFFLGREGAKTCPGSCGTLLRRALNK